MVVNKRIFHIKILLISYKMKSIKSLLTTLSLVAIVNCNQANHKTHSTDPNPKSWEQGIQKSGNELRAVGCAYGNFLNYSLKIAEARVYELMRSDNEADMNTYNTGSYQKTSATRVCVEAFTKIKLMNKNKISRSTNSRPINRTRHNYTNHFFTIK